MKWTHSAHRTLLLPYLGVFAVCVHVCVCQNFYHGQPCDYSSTFLLPHPLDCSIFLRCVNRFWRDSKCPAGGVFDRENSICTWPQKSRTLSCDASTTDTSKLSPVTECVYPCPEDGSNFMYPKWGTCTDFYYCEDKQLYTGTCSDVYPEGTYLYFNYFAFSCERCLARSNTCSWVYAIKDSDIMC